MPDTVTIQIRNGLVLLDDGFAQRDVWASSEGISLSETRHTSSDIVLDAQGLIVLPGIVDIHGDAFERQIMPRPGVAFPLNMALLETDRQLTANGITTAYHGVTWSWEPGLRSAEMARALFDALEAMRDRLAADTRFHLRHEIFNVAAEARFSTWLAAGRIGVLAFNDHMDDMVKTTMEKKSKLHRMVDRTGLSESGFTALVAQIAQQKDVVPASVGRLARAATAAGLPLLSHDDRHAEDRQMYRALGCVIAEFPKTVQRPRMPARPAKRSFLVHPMLSAVEAIRGVRQPKTWCVQGFAPDPASDYYYPALAQAPARLAAHGVATFEEAWQLVSTNPAKALGLADRGVIADGKRADLVLARRQPDSLEIVATIASGRIVFQGEARQIAAA